LGWAFAPVFLMGVAAASDWRVAYQAAVVLYAIVIGLLWWQRDKLLTAVPVRKADMSMTSGTDFLKLPVVWWCFAFFFLSTMTLAVVQSFGPSLLRALHGVSLEAATYTVTAYMLCGAVGMLVGGFIAAKHQRADVVVACSMGFGALLLLVCATGWLGALGTMACLAATGFAVGVGGPSRDMMIKRATPVGATGRVYGTVYSGLDLGFAVSPVLFGALMDKGHYALTLVGAAVFLACAVVDARSVGRRTLAV
jgi:predicted MFS family arabinose efflux permease